MPFHLFKPCGARTRSGSPCRRPATPGKSRCILHGGLSTGPISIEGKCKSEAAKLAGAARWREQQRARIVLGMATRFPSGRKSNAERARLARARAAEAPEWPRGATGDLATIARRFMERLYDPALLAPAVRPHELPAHLAHTRQAVMNYLAQTEAYAGMAALAGQPRGDEARGAIMARVRWEVASFLDRLYAVEQIEALKAERRQAEEEKQQADKLRGAMDFSARIVAGRDRRAWERASAPITEPRYHKIK
jgi:hypothetical protein